MRYTILARYSLICLIALLLSGYVLVSFHNRYQFDDLGFSALVKEHGVWDSFVSMYYSWETTYLTMILLVLLKGVDIVPPYFFNIAILLFNISSIFLFFKTLFEYFKLKLSSRDILLFSCLVIAITYFACRAMGNAVYWVTGHIVYCLFLSFLFLGLHFWIKRKLFWASVCMFLFAHTRINYDAIFLGLYPSYLVFDFYKNKKIKINWKAQIPFLFFLLGLITYVVIPGNYKRADSFHSIYSQQPVSIAAIIAGWISAFKHLAGAIVFSWKQLIVFPVGIVAGVYLSDNLLIKKLINGRLLIYCSLAFIISYLGQSTILSIAIRTPVGYGRIFFFLEILLFALILLYGMYFGIQLVSRLNQKLISLSICIISVTLIVAVCYYYFQNYKVTAAFAKAYDNRILELQEKKNNNYKHNVYLTSLPNSGILQFMEILPESENSEQYPNDNNVYVRYFKLPFKIYLAK